MVARLRGAGCVFAEHEAELIIETAATEFQLGWLVAERMEGQPLEHLVGWAEFYGLRILLDPGVFVPRRRTEIVVDQALRVAPPNPCIVELCCGSGAISAALLDRLGAIELYAADIDPAEAACARRNLPPESVFDGDLFEAIPIGVRGRVDVLIANGPYVPTGVVGYLPPEARLHEPRIALDGGADGLDVLRRVIADAPGWLAPGGHVIVQGSELQADALAAAMTASGLTPQVVIDPEQDDATAVLGRV